jgi:hypothetical protein
MLGEEIPSGSLHSKSHIAPSCGTSCFRSSKRILSTVSTRGLSPPCTHRTAPPLSRDPMLSPDAPDPGGPVNVGVPPNGAVDDDPNEPSALSGVGSASIAAGAGGAISRLRTLVMTSPAEFRTSISNSSSSLGVEDMSELRGEERRFIDEGEGVGWTVEDAPMTRAPRAR